MQTLLAAVTPHVAALVADLQAWCAIESPSSDAAATTRMAERLAAHLAARGASVDLLPGRQHGALVRATWPGAAGAAPILLLGHHDTVHPHGSLARNPPRVVGDRVYGPGGYDMKAGLLMAAAAVAALQAAGRPLPRPVVLLSTADEEIHSHDSRALIEATARQAAAVLVLEPAAASGALKTARKGVGMFTVVARGRAAHAGVDHAAGISATAEIAHQVLALAAMTDYPRGVTGTVRLFEHARCLGAAIGLALQETATGGASDGNCTAALGVPTLDGLGACGDGAHTDHEYVTLGALAPRIALLAGLLTSALP